MLVALAEGRALPAGELARYAGVRPATATAHLRQLVEAGLVSVRAQGRHRYHELAGPQVAGLLEALAQLAPATSVRSLRSDRAARGLGEARTCYDHLAGRRGVDLRDRLLATEAIAPVDERDHQLTASGLELLANLRIDGDALRSSRRVFARTCVDWTHRRPHLAGALPAALTNQLLELRWLRRGTGRELRLAADYDQRLDEWFASIGQ
jgi:DNA-binding transcriptional ArsR family regulator